MSSSKAMQVMLRLGRRGRESSLAWAVGTKQASWEEARCWAGLSASLQAAGSGLLGGAGEGAGPDQMELSMAAGKRRHHMGS